MKLNRHEKSIPVPAGITLTKCWWNWGKQWGRIRTLIAHRTDVNPGDGIVAKEMTSTLRLKWAREKFAKACASL